MFILPLGVEAKTVDVPWATLTIVVCVVFYSMLNLRISQSTLESYMEIPERRAYQVELKTYLVKICPGLIERSTCALFQKEVLPEHLRDASFVVRSLGDQLDAAQQDQLKIFLTPWMSESNVLRMNEPGPEFQTLRQALQKSQVKVKKLLKDNNLFSAMNRDPLALMRAQFLHGGLMHLFGNMLFLLLLAFPVEQRLGGALFLIVYAVAGTFGLWLNSVVSVEGLYIVGASANVFGIAGAFLALFMKQRMRILVSFFLLSHQVVLIPVALYFGLWIVLEEVLGVADLSGSNVAHIAHLGGFAVGFMICEVYQRLSPLGEGLVYPYEKALQIAAQRTVKPLRLFQTFSHWMSLNPSSLQAAQGLLISGAMMMRENPQEPSLRLFLLERWPKIFARNLKNSEFVEKIPFEWLRLDHLKVDPEKLRRCLAQYHERGQQRAEWVLLLYILWGREERGFPELEERLKLLSATLMRDADFVESAQGSALRCSELAAYFTKQGLWLGHAGVTHAG